MSLNFVTLCVASKKFKTANLNRFIEKAELKMFVQRVGEFLPPRPTQLWTIAYRTRGITFSTAEGVVGKTNAARSLKTMIEMGFMQKENGKYIAIVPEDLI